LTSFAASSTIAAASIWKDDEEACMSFTGRWRITSMELWDQEAVELVGPGSLRFDADGTGEISFVALLGWLDCRTGARDGKPLVEFSWDGRDEGDPVNGRGWAVLEGDDTLSGRIFIHNGDDSAFTARRWPGSVGATGRT